ncbi:MAG: hypothetical protein HDS25_06155 [Bacteroides sp.]|nr:hypothetical protein [Bacteroides sp.]
MTQNDIKYMIETISADIAEFLTNEFGMSISEALDTLYNSETYAKLIQPDTGLYFQSSRYVFSFLQEELAVGKIA